jgi:hypothetical protein
MTNNTAADVDANNTTADVEALMLIIIQPLMTNYTINNNENHNHRCNTIIAAPLIKDEGKL